MEKMMKKLMFALIAAVFCSSLMANVLIYDYAASFKRINVTGPITFKEKKEKYTLDSPKVVSDKFTGYMVIAECTECGGSDTHMQYSSEPGYISTWTTRYDGNLGKQVEQKDNTLGSFLNQKVVSPGNFAVVYIKRANSNMAYNGKKYDYRKRIYRAIGRFYVGMFGAKSGKDHYGDLVGEEKFTDAEGFLSYRLGAAGNVQVDTNNKVIAYKPGFLGMGHTGVSEIDWWFARYDGYYMTKVGNAALAVDYDTVDHAGFGKVYLHKEKDSSDCFEGFVPGDKCWRVKNLSGSMLGGFLYTSICSDFLFDICDRTKIAKNAPISGTFTLKLNNGLSFAKDATPADFRDAEDIILVKMGASKKSGKDLIPDHQYLYADDDETVEFNEKAGENLYRSGNVW